MDMGGISVNGGRSGVVVMPQAVRWTVLLKIVGAIALLALGAQIRIPLPGTFVPMTLQSLVVLFVGLTMSPGSASLATLMYLLCGAAGLPVFAAGSAGILGLTGGYLVGFLPAVLVAGWVRGRGHAGFGRLLVAAGSACAVLFACGVGWQAVLAGGDLRLAVATGLLPFAAKAVIQVFLVAALVAKMAFVRRSA
jgi:biotin transport system substrate-specific component